MELSEVFKKRRSSRHYLKKPVPRELLEELVISATKAPVSCNLQITQYIVVDDKEILDRLTKQVSYKFAYAPAYFIILYDPRFTVERNSIISSSAMSVENILLRAIDLGLSTCPMAGFDKDDTIRKIINIPRHIEILLIVSVGYADQSFEPLQPFKLDYKKVFSFNNYSGLKSLNASNDLNKQNTDDLIDYRSRISTVYLDRFRLNTYSEKYYGIAYDFWNKNIKNLNLKKVIDVLSYDGVFLRLLSKNKDISITSSDYLKTNLSFFQKTFGCNVVNIDSNNNFNTKEKYGCATLVFQLEFTPDPESLISSISNILEDKGLLFIFVSTEKWSKRFLKFILRQYRRFVLGKLNNIYEGNVFYKIGPRAYISNKHIENICKKYNLVMVKRETVEVGRGNKINSFALAKLSS